MEVELCSENSGLVMSPRISFSHDLSQFDVVPVEQQLFRSNSSSGNDFDFCIRERYDQESSSADELFSGGRILPTQIKKKIVPSLQIHQPEPPAPSAQLPSSKNDRLKETKGTNSESKSFWRIKRSSSLNCGSGYAQSLCPLPLLSRSNSTGSATTVKRSSSSLLKDHHKQTQKQNSQKNPSVAASKSSHSSCSGSYQKPPLKKSYGSCGNRVRINPVLNVPSGNLFGLGSIFFSAKDKNRKKS